MRFFLSSALLLLALIWAPSSQSADSDRGKLLYENHCQVCHDSQVHIRENRHASSLSDIRQWVVRWSGTLALKWGIEEQGDVAEYLFEQYY